MKLVICEKPSQAKSYSEAMKVTAKKGNYFEGNGYLITWCYGHLAGLANPDVYDEKYKKWVFEDLPILPDSWQVVVDSESGKRKQFKVIKELLNRKDVTEVICGTDAGREGELIFRHVYNLAKCKKPVKRLWLSSMEESAIISGFANLKNGDDYMNLYHSAFCRSKADWLVGMNFTRAFSILYNKKMNIGRVQTPTLAMIAERKAAILGFVKEKSYAVKLNDTAVSEKVKTLEEADKIVADCSCSVATVTSVTREKKTIKPPKLYDLCTLQREGNRIFGYTAQQTLDLVQSLYEKKLCSYPRTDSQHITDDMADSVTNLLTPLVEKMPFNVGKSYNPKNVQRLVNNRLVTDHYAVLPTSEVSKFDLDTFPETERNILFLVTSKLFCAIGENHVYESVKAEIECGGHIFTAHGKSVTAEGWRESERLFKAFMGRKSSDDTEETILDFTEGQILENADFTIGEYWTKPPAHYTEDTLLKAMERAGASDTTEEVERSGLGTPATRGETIEKIIRRGFAKRDKKNIVCTDAGAELISLAPKQLTSAKFTANWEDELARMAQGKVSPEAFMSDVETLVKEILKAAENSVDKSRVADSAFAKREVVGKCPRCGGDVVEQSKTFSCSNYKSKGCKFALWKENKFFTSVRAKITKPIAVALLKDGKIFVDRLYSAKKDRTFGATIVLEDNGEYANYRLEFTRK